MYSYSLQAVLECIVCMFIVALSWTKCITAADVQWAGASERMAEERYHVQDRWESWMLFPYLWFVFVKIFSWSACIINLCIKCDNFTYGYAGPKPSWYTPWRRRVFILKGETLSTEYGHQRANVSHCVHPAMHTPYTISNWHYTASFISYVHMSAVNNITLVQCADFKGHLHVFLLHRELLVLSKTS